MAETIWWCEEHGYQSFDGVDGSSCEDGVWLEGRGGWNCQEVVRILSAPGELIDPAKVDYEAAKVPYLDTLAMFASKMLRITHEEAMEREDIKEAARLVARASVDAALGVGEPVEGNGE